jgi:hypothetical protein
MITVQRDASTWTCARSVGAELQLAGLEGSPRYKPGAPFQYSQNDQWLRATWLAFKVLLGRVRHRRNVDIIISHAPSTGHP